MVLQDIAMVNVNDPDLFPVPATVALAEIRRRVAATLEQKGRMLAATCRIRQLIWERLRLVAEIPATIPDVPIVLLDGQVYSFQPHFRDDGIYSHDTLRIVEICATCGTWDWSPPIHDRADAGQAYRQMRGHTCQRVSR